METPRDFEGQLTEELMDVIKSHLIKEEFAHHYNRTYEAVYKVLLKNLKSAVISAPVMD